jgi:hypothetical protein
VAFYSVPEEWCGAFRYYSSKFHFQKFTDGGTLVPGWNSGIFLLCYLFGMTHIKKGTMAFFLMKLLQLSLNQNIVHFNGPLGSRLFCQCAL